MTDNTLVPFQLKPNAIFTDEDGQRLSCVYLTDTSHCIHGIIINKEIEFTSVSKDELVEVIEYNGGKIQFLEEENGI